MPGGKEEIVKVCRGSWVRVCMLIVICGFAVPLRADEVAIGASMAEVTDTFGKPRGRVSSGNTIVFSYERGTVTFTEGKVTAVNLVSPEDAERNRLERERQAVERLAAEAAARQSRMAAGTAERASTLADPTFTNRTTQAQLEYWRDFQNRYPEIPVEAEIAPLADALAEADREKAEDESDSLDRQIAELEVAIETLANRSGVGRAAFVQGNRDLKRMRAELEVLRQKQAERQ